MIPLSILDLAPIVEGASAADALHNSRDLAQHAEALGFKRFWLAEHHNMPGIASAATAVVIGHVAAGTQRIRVGAGGIMLPNHAPIIIAEQFGTLESLFPGRIDLGLGRAPGTDMLTARALRRDLESTSDRFPQDVVELLAYFEPAGPNQKLRAIPGDGLRVPVWLLGSSLFSAQLAAMLGLPFAFASHFAPDAMMQAIAIYRERFQPSDRLQKPHVMVGANVIVADTDEEARYLFTSLQQAFTHIRRGGRVPLPPPIADIDAWWSDMEKRGTSQALACAFVGAPATVKRGLDAFIAETGADELIAVGAIFDHSARRRSFSLLAELAGLQSDVL